MIYNKELNLVSRILITITSKLIHAYYRSNYIMTEYQLQLLRTETILPSKEAALSLLNAYVHHRIGQPVSVLYQDGADVRVLYAIGKKDPDDVAEGQPKCGPDFYDIIGDGSDADAVLAEDVTSNFPTNVGYVNTGDTLKKGTSLTEVVKKILSGVIYPDQMSTFAPLSVSTSVINTPTAAVVLTITDVNGTKQNSGVTLEAGTPLIFNKLTLTTGGAKGGEEVAQLTVNNSDSSNLLYGYKVNDSSTVYSTTHIQMLIADQTSSGYIKGDKTWQTGGLVDISITSPTTVEQKFNVYPGANSIKFNTVSAQGTATPGGDTYLYYLSNTGSISKDHMFTILAKNNQIKYGGTSTTYSWSCTGEYPVFTYMGEEYPVTLERESWTNTGWLPSSGVLIEGGITVPHGSYFAIAIPSSWKLKDMDAGMSGISCIDAVSSAAGTVSSLDGSIYTVYYIQATATGNTVYLNAKISKS